MYMKILKFYVRNYAQPEGCIAEKYLIDESMRFFRIYTDCDTTFNTESCNEDDTVVGGRPLFKGKAKEFSDKML